MNKDQKKPPKGYYSHGFLRIQFRDVFYPCHAYGGQLTLRLRKSEDRIDLGKGEEVEFLEMFDAWLDYQDEISQEKS